MLVAILSDLHLGFAYGSELENDSFEMAEKAVEQALQADLVLLPGDIFDSRAPRTSIFAKAIGILAKLLTTKDKGVRLVESDKEIPKVCRRCFAATPLLSLYGNHERKGRGEINPVDALERAGILLNLDANRIVVEKDGERIAIQGMSNVPERFAREKLVRWNPKPVEGCFNILMLHQSIHPYVFSPLDPPTLSLQNLPFGFDLIVNGHVHQPVLDKIGRTSFVIPGSTCITQFEKVEAETKKGIYLLDTKLNKLEFLPLDGRRFFYEEVELDSSKPFGLQVEEKLLSILSEEFDKRPLVRMKLVGEEEKILDPELRRIERKFAEKAILSFVKEVKSKEIAEKLEFLRGLREQRLSLEQIGMNLLKKNLEELGFDFSTITPEKLFSLLEESSEKAFQILAGKQLTLDWLR